MKKKLHDAMAWARAEYTPLGSFNDPEDWETQHARTLADEVERLTAELAEMKKALAVLKKAKTHLDSD